MAARAAAATAAAAAGRPLWATTTMASMSSSSSSSSSSRAALTLRRHAASTTVTAAAAAAAGRAPVLVSLVVERNPVVVPESPPFEAAYERYQAELANERAKPFSEDFFTKKTDSKADADAEADERSAEDKVDYAPRRTPDDEAGKTDTLNRCAATGNTRLQHAGHAGADTA